MEIRKPSKAYKLTGVFAHESKPGETLDRAKERKLGMTSLVDADITVLNGADRKGRYVRLDNEEKPVEGRVIAVVYTRTNGRAFLMHESEMFSFRQYLDMGKRERIYEKREFGPKRK